MPGSMGVVRLAAVCLCLVVAGGAHATDEHPTTLGSYKIVERQDQEECIEAKLDIQRGVLPDLGRDVNPLKLLVNASHPDTLHLKISPVVGGRWDIPDDYFLRPEGTSEAIEKVFGICLDESPFAITVHPLRGGYTSAPLFTTNKTQLVFKDQYMEVTSLIPKEASLYGAGEFTPSKGFRLQRNGKPIALWNRDMQAKFPDVNLYGSRPFVMSVLPDGTASGILLLNSNGMDIIPEKDRITWKAIGGVLDFYIFAGPTPADVMRQLTAVVGRPHLPPYWSLGFHNCKWGYKTVEEAEEVVRNYSRAGIPLETMWTDIDYMDGNRDFSLEPVRYAEPKMKAFLDRLHAANQSWVPIIDAGIKVDPGYPAYDDGIASDVFVKDATGAPYIGQVWPGPTHFPDFGHQSTVDWWKRQIAAAHELSAFDGLWIDMDEVSNFCTGEVCELAPPGPSMTNCYLPCHNKLGPSNGSTGAALGDWWPSAKQNASLRSPPYAIHNGGEERLPLDTKTMPVTASNLDGTLQYDTHNIYGLAEAKATHEALVAIKQTRPFILTRSTFIGSGAYAAHWTGDNAATWDDLRWSIPGVFQSGVTGIPFVGPDICGFLGNTTEELCARWISVGAFYPFSRDHSDINGGYQELYRWEAVAGAARTALGLRYKMLPTLYTIFKHSRDTGAPIARPLFFGWPHDPITHTTDAQFLLGDSILVSPVLHEGANSVKAYFPQGKWYSAFDHSEVDASEGGKHVELSAPLGKIPVHILEGSVLPMGPPGTTTAAVRTGSLSLLVALNTSAMSYSTDKPGQDIATSRRLLHQQARAGPAVRDHSCPVPERSRAHACGSMFLDDGLQLQVTGAEGHVVKFAASLAAADANGMIQGAVDLSFALSDGPAACADVAWPAVENVTILGHPPASIGKVELVTSSPSGLLGAADVTPDQVSWHPASGALMFTSLDLTIACPTSAQLRWEI